MADRGLASTLVALGGVVLLSIGLVAAAGSQGIERRARGMAGYAGPSPLLVFAASIPVSILAIVVLALPLAAAGVALDGPLGALLSVALQAGVYVGLIRLLVVDTGALDWGAMGVRRHRLRRGRRNGRRGALGGPGHRPDHPDLGDPAGGLPGHPAESAPADPVRRPGSRCRCWRGSSLLRSARNCCSAGFATTAWVRGLGIRGGLVRAALLFALAHVLTISSSTLGDAFGLAVVGFVTRVPIALALGWLFTRRGTIWSSFGLHATFNLVLLVIAQVASRSI